MGKAIGAEKRKRTKRKAEEAEVPADGGLAIVDEWVKAPLWTGEDLYVWLSAIPNRQNCRVVIECGEEWDLEKAKVYDEDRDGVVDVIYIIGRGEGR